MKWRSGQRRHAPKPDKSPPPRPVTVIGPDMTWPAFWDFVQVRLRDRGYRRSSLVVVRQVLRGLAGTCGVRPSDVTRDHLDSHFRHLTFHRCSASWLAMNMSILRTVFDKLCGRSLLEGRLGPKRPDRLPRILSLAEVDSLLNTAKDFREALLLGLLADCGLKIGEACACRWFDVHPEAGEIHVAGSGSSLARTVPIPLSLTALLCEGKRRFRADTHILQGRRPGTALSTRMAERIVRRCARRGGLPHHVTSMVLRHTFAVQALETGVNIRELQTRLGHASVETTMRYQRCLPPEETLSPLDTIYAAPAVPTDANMEPAEVPPPTAEALTTRQRGLIAWLRHGLRRASG